MKVAVEELVGLAEIAEMFGVERQYVFRWAKRGDFPEPVARLRMGPIWRRPDIEDWAEQAKRPIKTRPPRPADTAP